MKPISSLDRSLLQASQAGDLLSTQRFLSRGANVNVQDDAALVMAAKRGHLGMVRLLLAAGADPNQERALCKAAMQGHFSIVRLLVEKGAKVSAGDALAFRLAAETGRTSVVHYLLKKGADVHSNHDEALKKAIKNHHLLTTQALIAGGADPLLGLHLAKQHHHTALSAWIEAFFQSAPPPSFPTSKKAFSALVQFWKQRGLPRSSPDQARSRSF